MENFVVGPGRRHDLGGSAALVADVRPSLPDAPRAHPGHPRSFGLTPRLPEDATAAPRSLSGLVIRAAGSWPPSSHPS